jgi:hypothetical protein
MARGIIRGGKNAIVEDDEISLNISGGSHRLVGDWQETFILRKGSKSTLMAPIN